MVQDIVINGLINGSIYALLAIGFSLIFGVARLVNIAHTAFAMVATYLLYIGLNLLGIAAVLALVASVLITIIVGVICYQLFIKPIREHEAAVLIATIALGMVIQEIFLYAFGGHYRGVPPLASGFSTLGGVKVANQHIVALAVALLALAATWFLLFRTKIGLAHQMHRPGSGGGQSDGHKCQQGNYCGSRNFSGFSCGSGSRCRSSVHY